ncbi:MAG: diguanylate cyclase [Ignavibacteriales bacterium]
MRDLAALVVGILTTSSIFLVSMGAYSLRMKASAKAKTFFVVCLAVAVYSMGYAMELVSGSINEALFWNRAQYLALPFLAPFWVVLVIQHRGRERDISWAGWLLLFLVPILTLIIRWTPSLSHLLYATVTMVKHGSLTILQIGRGPWYVVSAVHISAGILYAGLTYLKGTTPSATLRAQAMLMVVASCLPLVSLWALVANVSPLGLDTAPFSLSLSSVLLYVALIRYRFFDIVPLGHERVFESTSDGVFIVTGNGDLAEFNPAAARMFPFLDRRSIGKPYHTALKGYVETIRSLEEPHESEIAVRRDDGTSNYYRMRITPLNDRQRNRLGSMITYTDITPQVRTLRDMERAASTDELTGIANRGYSLARISSALEKARQGGHPFCMLMLDLDFLKAVNDKYGHHAGDFALRHVANVCQESIRSVDILGRYGGDEFIIALPGARIVDGLQAAKRIQAAARSNAPVHEGETIQISFSIGVAGADPVTDETVDTFLRSADNALYQAKGRGRDCVESIQLGATFAGKVSAGE